MRSSSIRPGNSASAVPSSNSQQLVVPDHVPNSSLSNILKLLSLRELSPRTKRAPKRFWREASNYHVDSPGKKHELAKDARQEIRAWVEAESLLNLSAKYCPLLPPPRSTIAAAFSPDGKTLASTHGDHSVKIIDFQTGKCLKVLNGHRRTPWVVRFHPIYPEVLASGSLDHEVRLWDAKTAECIGSRDFYRPIASIAFHAQGEILAVASGHKLYIWHYNRRGDASSPAIILKTRRSLRAVHFHPHAAPFLLTAEVNDLDSSDPSMTVATSPGYLCYPPPTIYLADSNPAHQLNAGNELRIMSIPFIIWPSIGRGDAASSLTQLTDVDMSSSVLRQNGDSSASTRLLTYSTPSGQYELVLSLIQPPVREERQNNTVARATGNDISQPVETTEADSQVQDRSNHLFGDPAHWELPFLQGWLIGQSQAGQQAMHSQTGGPTEGLHSQNGGPIIPNVVSSRAAGRSGSRYLTSHRMRQETIFNDGATFNSIQPEQGNSQAFINPVQSEASVASLAAAAELPCTVKLRIWYHDMKNPCAPLDAEQCRLTIRHAVLCRFLAVCVACILPNIDADSGWQGQVQRDVTGASTSPTRHPISAHQVMYELRIYSLEEATFGSVLNSRAIRAAHCLTSIQFSPTSEHLLLAYGRRHSSLLKSVLINGESTVPIYTILEIYRVSDMELVKVLPSAEDEVNVACFHPSVGGGFVYGTKEGKLRILQCNISRGFHSDESWGPEDNIEVQTFALEG